MAYMKKEMENRLLDLLTEATQVTKTLTDRVVELEDMNAFLTAVIKEMTRKMNTVTKKFPRYTIDDDCTDYGWHVVVDASQGGIHAAMFYTMEHAQEWVENHQEWLDSEPGTD